MAKKNSTTEKSELDLCKFKRPGIPIHDEPTVYNPGLQWDEVQRFTEWCLSTDKYIYNKNNKSWFDNRGFKFLTWDEIYVKFLNEEYKQKRKLKQNEEN